MDRQIRPLTAFKKAEPWWYEMCNQDSEGLSKKAQENQWYWKHCWHKLANLGIEWRPPSFFYENYQTMVNIGTISEIGRLLLLGWYYNAEDFTIEVAMYVYRAWQKKKESGELFNDLEFKRVVQKIRENASFYFNNQDELKLYILESFFKTELTPLLPPKPKELQLYEEVKERLTKEYRERIKKNKYWYVHEHYLLESYNEYLTELLEGYGISGYYSLDEFKARQNEEAEDDIKNLAGLQVDWREGVKSHVRAISEGILKTPTK